MGDQLLTLANTGCQTFQLVGVFQWIAGTHQPPNPVKVAAFQGRFADMDMALMGRIKRAAKKANRHSIFARGKACRLAQEAKIAFCKLHDQCLSVRAYLAIAAHPVFKTGQLLNADGTTRMHFAGCNTDFRAHAKFAAIAKLG